MLLPLFGMLFAGSAGYFAFSGGAMPWDWAAESRSPLEMRLRFSPPDTSAAAMVDLDGLKNRPMFLPMFGKLKESLLKVAAERGVEDPVLPSRIYFFGTLDRGAVTLLAEFSGGMEESDRINNLLFDYRTEADPEGRRYVSTQESYAFAPGPKEFVLIRKRGADLETALAGGGGLHHLSPEMPGLMQAVEGRDAWAVIDVKRAGVTPEEADAALGLDKVLARAWPGVRGAAIWVDVKGSTLEVSFALVCGGGADAARVAVEVEKAVPRLKFLVRPYGQLLDGARFKAQGSAAVLSVALDKDRFEALINMVELALRRGPAGRE